MKFKIWLEETKQSNWETLIIEKLNLNKKTALTQELNGFEENYLKNELNGLAEFTKLPKDTQEKAFSLISSGKGNISDLVKILSSSLISLGK